MSDREKEDILAKDSERRKKERKEKKKKKKEKEESATKKRRAKRTIGRRGADKYDSVLKAQESFRSWAGHNYIWCPHPTECYCVGQIVQKEEDGSVQVLTEYGQTLTLKEDDVLPMNPPKFDGVDDNAKLGHLNQPCVLHNLKTRYAMDLIYTYSGLFLVSINPYKQLPIYTPEIVDYYRGKRREEVPPHIFATADNAYRAMLNDGINQSMLITGESGAGKTENTKKVIQYLAAVAGSKSGRGQLENQILQANPVLEAFGNARTLRNNNSSRFGKFIEIQFDKSGYIAGATIQTYLLETSRVIKQAKGERNFHIFYQLTEGASEEEAEKYQLQDPDTYKYLNQSGCFNIQGVNEASEFNATKMAMKIIGFTDEERDNIFKTISAILHLGNLEFSPKGEGSEITEKDPLFIVSSLLGCDAEKLEFSLTKPLMKVGTEVIRLDQSPQQAADNREALVKAIYARLFDFIVMRVNQSLSQSKSIHSFIGVLDIAGFEIFEKNSFEQLCINYTNEKLQQFFNHHMFKKEQEEYMKEQIDWNFIDFGLDLQDCIDLIEKHPLGIMSMLNEQSLLSAKDEDFVNKLKDNYKDSKVFKTTRFGKVDFVVSHYAGQVTYDASGWTEKNKDPLTEDAKLVMSTAETAYVRNLFSDELVAKVQSLVPENKKAAQQTKGAKFLTVSATYKRQLQHLMEVLNATEPHFIRCILPNNIQKPGIVDAKLVLDQLNCNGVLEGIRIQRKGFPTRVPFAEFLKNYSLLCPGEELDGIVDIRRKCAAVIDHLELDADKFRLGLTKVFFRAGVLADLEELREEKISQIIVVIQAAMKSYVARKRYQKMIEKSNAAKTIQKNIRAWMKLRTWPWWKLFGKVRPMLKTLKFEEQLREAEQELESLKNKYGEETENRERLQGLLDDKEDELEGYRQSLFEAQEKRMNLESRIADLESKLDELNEHYEKEAHNRKELQNARRTLEKQMAELQQRLAEEEGSRKGLQGSKDSLEAQIADLKKNLAQKTQQGSELDSKSKQLAKDLELVRTQLAEEESQRKTSAKKAKDLDGRVRELQEQLEELQAKYAALVKAKEKVEAELRDTQAKLASEEAAKQSLQAEHDRIKAELEKTKSELGNQTRNREELERIKKRLEGELTETKDSVEDVAGRKESLEKNLRNLQRQLIETEEGLRTSQDEKAQVQTQKELAEQEAADLKRRLAAEQEAVAQLQSEKANLERQLKETETAAAEERDALKQKMEKTRKKLEAQVSELQTQYDDLLSSKGSTDKAQKETLNTLRTAQADLSSVKREKESLEDRLAELEEELRRVRAQLADAEGAVAEYERAKKNLEGKVKDVAAAQEASEEQVTKIQQQKKKAEQEVASLQQKVAEAEGDKSALAEDKRRLEGEVENLKRQVQTEKERTAELERKMEQMKREMAALKEEALDAVNAKQAAVLEKAKRQMEEELAEISEQLKSEMESKADLAKESNKLKKKVQQLEKDAKSADRKASDLDSELRRVESEAAALKGSLEMEQSARAKAESEKRSVEGKVAELEEAVEAEEGKAKRLAQANKKLEAVVAELREAASAGDVSSEEVDALRADYEQKLRRAEQDLSSIKAQSAALASENQSLQREIAALKEQAEEAVSRNKTSLEKARRQSEEQVQEMYEQLQKEAEAKNKAVAQAMDLERKLKEAQRKAAKESSKKADAEARKRHEEELEMVKGELSAQRQAKETLEREKLGFQAKVAELQDKMASAEKQRMREDLEKQSLKAEIQQLREQIIEAEAAQAELDEIREDSEYAVEAKGAELEKEKARRQAIEDQLDRLRSEMKQQTQRMKEAEERSADSQSRVKAQFEHDLRNVQNRLKETEEAKEKAERQASQLEKEVAKLKRRERAQPDAGSVFAEKMQYEADLRRLNRTVEDQQRSIDGVESENRRLKREVEDWKDMKNSIQMELDRLRTQLETEKAKQKEMQAKFMSLF